MNVAARAKVGDELPVQHRPKPAALSPWFEVDRRLDRKSVADAALPLSRVSVAQDATGSLHHEPGEIDVLDGRDTLLYLDRRDGSLFERDDRMSHEVIVDLGDTCSIGGSSVPNGSHRTI